MILLHAAGEGDVDERKEHRKKQREELLLQRKKKNLPPIAESNFDVNLIVAAVLGEGVHEECQQLEDGVEGGQADEDVHKACLGLPIFD